MTLLLLFRPGVPDLVPAWPVLLVHNHHRRPRPHPPGGLQPRPGHRQPRGLQRHTGPGRSVDISIVISTLIRYISIFRLSVDKLKHQKISNNIYTFICLATSTLSRYLFLNCQYLHYLKRIYIIKIFYFIIHYITTYTTYNIFNTYFMCRAVHLQDRGVPGGECDPHPGGRCPGPRPCDDPQPEEGHQPHQHRFLHPPCLQLG